MRKEFLIFFLLLTLLFSFSSAHLDAGQDNAVENYIIDFGHSPEEIVIQQRTVFSFSLLDKNTQEIKNFERLWVRIAEQDNVVFTGTFHPEQGQVVFTYMFPSAGRYEITTRFLDEMDELVETNFSINVNDDWLGYVLLIMFVLIIATILLHRKIQRKKAQQKVKKK